MLALRSTLFHLFQLVTVIPYALLCFLWAPLPLHWRYRLTLGWPRMVIWAARVFCGVRWQVIGAENLPTGRAIVLSKHQSTWETFFLVSWLPKELVFVFKRELLYVPFFGWGIGLLKMIHIDRSKGNDAFEQVVVQGEKKLSEGRWIIMFPEGTRIPVGKAGKYRTGGARLAVRTGSAVVPIAHNAGECWPRRAFILKPGLITVSIGPSIHPHGLTADELNQRTQTWIETEMRRLNPERYAEPAAAELPSR